MHRLDLPFDKVKPVPEECINNELLDAITDAIEKELGWKNLIGGVRKNLKVLIPIIQKHLNNPR